MKLGLTCNINGIAITSLSLSRLNIEAPVRVSDVKVSFVHQTKEATTVACVVEVGGSLPKHLEDKAEELLGLIEDHLAGGVIFGASSGTSYIKKDDLEGIV